MFMCINNNTVLHIMIMTIALRIPFSCIQSAAEVNARDFFLGFYHQKDKNSAKTRAAGATTRETQVGRGSFRLQRRSDLIFSFCRYGPPWV